MQENSKKILGIYLGFILGEAVCISAFALEITRALDGNLLSWAYVVEWPIFSIYIVYMWRKLLRDERAAPPLIGDSPHEPDDPALVAWNDYLFEMHHGARTNDHTANETPQ